MPKFFIALGLTSLLSLGWVLRAQEPTVADPPAPSAEPADPAELAEKDIPRALPVEAEIPRAKPVATEELEGLKRTREEKRQAEDAEILRIKLERIETENRRARAAAENPPDPSEEAATSEPDATGIDAPGGIESVVIPRAIPVRNPAAGTEPEDELPELRLSPMDVASMRAPDGPEREPETSASKIQASWMTRTDARSFTMLIPAPRGQIVDRWGKPLVQNKVANILSIKLPHLDGASDRELLTFARTRVDRANRTLGEAWEVTDEAILTHYENRRWLPLMFSGPLTAEQEEAITPYLDKGMILFPTYVRHYPEKNLAAHVVGYAGKTRRLPTGPVVSGDPLFPQIDAATVSRSALMPTSREVRESPTTCSTPTGQNSIVRSPDTRSQARRS